MTPDVSIFAALFAGLISFLSPCVLPLVPPYLVYLAGASMERLAQGCDVLVHMCHYISGTQLCEEFAESCMGHLELARLGAKAGVKTLVMSHVTEQIDQPGVRERIVREMSAIYAGNLIFGEDRLEIPVAGPVAAKLL